MDVLSRVLSQLKPETFVSAGLDAGSSWAIQFPAHGGIKFNAVIQGACQLQVDGDPNIYNLQAGDCFLLTSGKGFRMSSDLSLPAIPSASIYDQAVNNVAICNGGGAFFLIGARFHFEPTATRFLFGQLPPVVYVQASMDSAAVLRWGLDLFTKEFHNNLPGKATVMAHLAPLMLLQTLRIYLGMPAGKDAGWLAASLDAQLGQALTAIHAQPGTKWTVALLAVKAGMSRSGFALKFKTMTGLAPLEYLTRWRMLLASQYLEAGKESLYEIASTLGYDSQSAFGVAFKKCMGCSPQSFAKKRSNNLPSHHAAPGI